LEIVPQYDNPAVLANNRPSADLLQTWETERSWNRAQSGRQAESEEQDRLHELESAVSGSVTDQLEPIMMILRGIAVHLAAIEDRLGMGQDGPQDSSESVPAEASLILQGEG